MTNKEKSVLFAIAHDVAEEHFYEMENDWEDSFDFAIAEARDELMQDILHALDLMDDYEASHDVQIAIEVMK